MNTTSSSCLLLGLLPLVLGQIATAQTGAGLVLPKSMQGVEGSGSTNVPFGRSVAMRAQFVYDHSLIPTARLLKKVSFRPDQAFGGAGKRVYLHLHVGTMAGDVTKLSSTFKANYGRDYTDVFTHKYISLPARTSFPKGEEFPIPVPFDRSFAYDPKLGSLLMDYQVRQQPQGAYLMDSTYTCVSPLEAYGPAGCGPLGGVSLKLESLTKNIVWNNLLVMRVSNAPANALTMLFFGAQGSGNWAGITLPWHADVIGAPGCYLSTSILHAPRRSSDALGRADFGWVVPPIIRIYKTDIYVQAIAANPIANPLGVVTSRGARLRFCGFEPVGRVFANGDNALVGALELGVASIVRVAGS